MKYIFGNAFRNRLDSLYFLIANLFFGSVSHQCKNIFLQSCEEDAVTCACTNQYSLGKINSICALPTFSRRDKNKNDYKNHDIPQLARVLPLLD